MIQVCHSVPGGAREKKRQERVDQACDAGQHHAPAETRRTLAMPGIGFPDRGGMDGEKAD
jgi:hypothetical protein